MAYRCADCAELIAPAQEVPTTCSTCGGDVERVSTVPAQAASEDGAVARVSDPPTRLTSSQEEKFQHFLEHTVRAGSRYGGCGGFGSGTWGYDAEHHTWTVRKRVRTEVDLGPQIYFGCVGLVASFLTYWYNYNEDAGPVWSLAVGPGISYALAAELGPGTVNEREGVLGLRPAVADPVELDCPGQFTTWRSFVSATQVGGEQVPLVGTAASFINDGLLRYVCMRGGRARFEWDPSYFANFNICVISSHHVILWVKRAPDGGPPRGDGTDQMWRLGADINGKVFGRGLSTIGGPTSWELRPLAFRTCQVDHRHRGPARERGARGLATRIREDLPGFEELPRAYQREPVAWESERLGCAAPVAIYKLRDLEGTAAPFLDRPSRPIQLLE